MYAIRSYYAAGVAMPPRSVDDRPWPNSVITSYSIHYTKLYEFTVGVSFRLRPKLDARQGLYTYALSLTRDREAAEDAVQAAIVNLLRRGP